MDAFPSHPHVVLLAYRTHARAMRTYRAAECHTGMDYRGNVGRSGVLWAIAGTITKPSATFKTISHDPERYLASSVAVFGIVCLGSVLQLTMAWLEPNNDVTDNLGVNMLTYATSLITTVLQNLLIIAAIFWIGGRYGRSQKFKNVFPVLAYCLIPMAIAAVVIPAGMQVLDPNFFMYGDSEGTDDLSPSYALDFAGIGTTILIQNAFAVSFMAWTLVLLVKATKASYGLGTGKAAGVLALAAAATYASVVAFGILMGLFLLLLLPPTF